MGGVSRRFLNLVMDNRIRGVRSLRCIDLTRHHLFNTTIPAQSPNGKGSGSEGPQDAPTSRETAAVAGSQGNKQVAGDTLKMEEIRLPSPSFSICSSATSNGWDIGCIPLAGHKVFCTDHSGWTIIFDANMRQVDILPILQRPKSNPNFPTLVRREGTNNWIDDAELPSARRRHRLRVKRDLVAAEALFDDRAKDAYGDVLGMVFSPIFFQLDTLPPIREPPAAEQPESTENVPTASVTSTISEFFKRMIFPPLNPNLLQEFDIQKISWNPHKHCLAFMSGKNQVIVHDFEDSDAKEPFILTSDQQTNVKAVEWRPNSGNMIAVACKGGICLWSASYPGDVPFMKAGVTPYSFSAFPRGSGGRWILVDVLRDSSAEQVTTLCWKPDGRYLASASCNSPSFTIWDVSQGLGTPIRRGLSNISLLRWSPSGDYLLAAKFDGTFHFWETKTWTSEPWSSSNGYVSGANWDPEGRVALVSFSDSTTLGSIHFSSKPPSLDAHLKLNFQKFPP